MEKSIWKIKYQRNKYAVLIAVNKKLGIIGTSYIFIRNVKGNVY